MHIVLLSADGRSWMSPALLPASWHPWITWFEAKAATNSWKSRRHEIGECSFISWTYLVPLGGCVKRPKFQGATLHLLGRNKSLGQL
jgi:hypothetical protein